MGTLGRPTPPAGLADRLRETGAWAVVPHVLPDVDALASAAALALVLRGAGLAARVLAPDVPEIHRWALQGEPATREPPGVAEATVAVDTARPDRLQWSGAVSVNVDHHEDNPGFGAANWVEAAPSCTCLVAALAAALGVPLEPQLATLLYAGLVGDTEGFRVGLAPEVFAWAERFCAAGADAEGVAESFHRRSPGFWGYLAAADAAGFTLDGWPPCRVVPIPADLPARFALLPYENALLPSHLSPPPGGVLAILQEGRENVRFRLRSRGPDVLPLAHALGGGGHPRAAGAVLRGARLADAVARLRRAWEALGAAPPAPERPA